MIACAGKQEGYNSGSIIGVANMPKINPLTFEIVSKLLSYDPVEGTFTWLVDVARNVKAGDKAGCAKSCRSKSGKEIRYIYIRINNVETPAARIAWLLQHGKFPRGNLQFADGDTSNLRINNLRETVWYRPSHEGQELKVRKLNKTAMRHYGLKRLYGLSIDAYNTMLAAQNGVCAICERPESGRNASGELKPFSVDHNHETGEIRGLLCTQCNYMIGHCRESRDILLAGVRYLDKHSGREAATPALTIVPTEGKPS
jgi:Recombination endonuclease VII